MAVRLALRVAWRPCKTALPFCRTLARVLTLPQGDLCIQKSPNFRSGFLMEYGGEGGIHGGAARLALRVAWRPCKTALPFCRTLARVLTLPQGDLCIQKSPNFRSGFLMEYGGEGGIHGGAARLALRVAWRPCKTALPFCRTLARVLTLPQGDLCIQKSPNFRSGFLMEYGGEGGIRTLDTFSRIHTFQACSFSLSDTSPVVILSDNGRYCREIPLQRQHTYASLWCD